MQFPIIQEHSALKQAVSARELFKFLEVNDRFSVWFERQLQYGFIESVDYLGCRIYDDLARQDLDDYAMTIDMSKQVAMIQKSVKGMQVRQYFLECERQALSVSQPAFQIPQTLGEALQLAANQALQIEHDAPKVNFYNTVAERDNLMTVTQVASKLGMSAQELNKRLVTLGAYDGRIKRCKTFTSEFIAKGYGKMKIGSTGHDQGLITQLGQQWIVGLFNVEVQL